MSDSKQIVIHVERNLIPTRPKPTLVEGAGWRAFFENGFPSEWEGVGRTKRAAIHNLFEEFESDYQPATRKRR
jgi:hypothetical protein